MLMVLQEMFFFTRDGFTGSSMLCYPSRDQLLPQCRHTTIEVLILSHWGFVCLFVLDIFILAFLKLSSLFFSK